MSAYLRTHYPRHPAAQPERDDPRYEHVTCPACGIVWQRMDYRSALHHLTCSVPEEPLTLVSDPRELWRVPMDTSCASTVRDERAEREQAEYEREQAERGR